MTHAWRHEEYPNTPRINSETTGIGVMPGACTVILSFDFDAEALWEDTYQLATPSPLSRGAYGANLGMPRILALLQRYALPATFYVPGITAERYPDLVRRAHDAGHEIGHHGYRHVSPTNQSEPEEREGLERGLEILERLTGTQPRGYRSPSWDLSAHTLRLLHEYRFLYDSSLMAWDAPYLIDVPGASHPLVEIPVSWELDDAPYFLFAFRPAYRAGLADPDRVLRIWCTEFEGAYTDKEVICYTMHPQIIGRRHRLQILEGLIRHIRQFPDVRFARAVDVAAHLAEQRE